MRKIYYSLTPKKILLLIGIIFLIIIIGLLIYINSVPMGMKPSEINALFKGKKYQPVAKIYNNTEDKQAVKVAAMEIGDNDSLPLVILVHGSPGGWDAYSKYLADPEMQDKVRMVAIDRLGYGGTNKGKPETSLVQQSNILKPIISQKKHNQKVILVGHSYGGPVIARFAMDYPDLVDGLVFLAPSIDPSQEKVKWYQRVGGWKVIRWALPSWLDVCNREILPLKKELTDMLPLWKNIRCPVLFLHGKKDKLVPYANALFAEKQLAHVPFDLTSFPEENHFIVWTQFEVVKRAILKACDRD